MMVLVDFLLLLKNSLQLKVMKPHLKLMKRRRKKATAHKNKGNKGWTTMGIPHVDVSLFVVPV